jgi:hypothetical protein
MHPSLTNPTRVIHHNRGFGYGVAGSSGVIAAALAQDSIVFSILCGPQGGAPAAGVVDNRLSVWFDRLRLAFTTIAAFTTPMTAARRLGLYRATNAGAAVTAARSSAS